MTAVTVEPLTRQRRSFFPHRNHITVQVASYTRFVVVGKKSCKMLFNRIIRRTSKLQLLMLMAFTIVVFVIGKQIYDSRELEEEDLSIYRQPKSYMYSDDGKPRELVTFDHSVPLIWVGGVPRSGTTLARAMLDAHPEIRCGEETRVIPRILGMHAQMMKSNLESTRLLEAKITEDVLNEAMGA